MKVSKKHIRFLNTKKSLNKFISSIVLFRVLLDICFNIFISPLWSRSNYGLFYSNDFSILIYLISWFILLISMKWAYDWYKGNNFSSITLIMLYCISFIPFTTMFAFSSYKLSFVVSNFLYWLMIYLFSSFFRKIKRETVYVKTKTNRLFSTTIFALSTVMMYLLGKHSGFRINLNIKDVYELRSTWNDISLPSYIAYLLGFVRFTTPLGIYYFIKKKQILFLMVLIINTLINYSFDGGKTLLFLSAVSVFMGLFVNEKHINLVLPSFPILMVISFLEYFLYKGYMFLFIIRRLFFVPNLINSYVHDFMMSNPPNYFSQLLRFIGITPSNVNINYEIGALYFNLPTMSSNSGTIADAIWQLGYFGIIILPFIICVFLYFTDTTTKNITPVMLLMPSLITAYYINNSSITAALFSHGLLLFSLFMVLYSRKESNDRQNNTIRIGNIKRIGGDTN